LNLVVIAVGIFHLIQHPATISTWRTALLSSDRVRGNWVMVIGISLLVFPKLALGLSGFETGVAVMPLVKGSSTDTEQKPAGRIRNTKKLLMCDALIMSVMLVASSFVTSLSIPAEAFRAAVGDQPAGKASGRALAYLAHQNLGEAFGTLYDISTILILWFAGASAMAGLLNIIPRYLPRFGLAPEWSAYSRPLVLLLFGINVAVTLVFRANVEAQGGAYATGVLVLMLSAAVAAALALRRDGHPVQSLFCWIVAAIFAYTLVDN